MTVEEFLKQQNIALPSAPPPEAMPAGVAGFTPSGTPIAAPNLPPPEPAITQRPSALQTAKDVGTQLAVGALGPALGETAALKAIPALQQRTLPAALGRIGGSAVGGMAAGALTNEGGSPGIGAAIGALQGALGGGLGELGQWGGGKMWEAARGGPYRRVADFANKAASFVGLPQIVGKAREEGQAVFQAFRSKPQAGSTTPSSSPVELYDRTVYAPVKQQVAAALPGEDIELPTMTKLAQQKKVAAIPEEALQRNDWPLRQKIESKMLTTLPKQGQGGGYAALQAARQSQTYGGTLKAPFKWSLDDIDATIKHLERHGYNPVSGEAKGAAASPEAIQDAHNLVEELHQYIATNASPKLATQWRKGRNDMTGLLTIERILKNADMPTEGGPKAFGLLQAEAIKQQGNLERAFGPEKAQELVSTLTRQPGAPRGTDQPGHSSIGGGTSMYGVPHFFPHIRPGTTMKPPVQPGLPQMLKTGIPGAIIQRLFGIQPFPQQEDQ